MKKIILAHRCTMHIPTCKLDVFEQEFCFSSPVRTFMSRAIACIALAAIFPCCPLALGHAYAATWPVPTSELSASVAFHETYSAGDKSYVHSGIDIPASAGMQISSPQAGTVRYTGVVPSGDSRVGQSGPSQKTMTAVSIELQDGRVVTLMPFSSTCVSQGEHVQEGECLGTLAPSGDPSSSQVHLHMGLKSGRAYCDPMSLFGGVLEGPPDDAPESQEPAYIEGVRAAGLPGAALDPGTEAPAQEIVLDADRLSSAELETVPQVSLGTIESGVVNWKPSTKEVFDPVSAVANVIEPLLASCYAQAADLLGAISGLSHGLGVHPLALLVMCFIAAIAFVALFAFIVFRFIAPHVRDIWRKRIPPLFMRGGGDSMHKLFPASGTAFISRSRISPREVTK